MPPWTTRTSTGTPCGSTAGRSGETPSGWGRTETGRRSSSATARRACPQAVPSTRTRRAAARSARRRVRSTRGADPPKDTTSVSRCSTAPKTKKTTDAAAVAKPDRHCRHSAMRRTEVERLRRLLQVLEVAVSTGYPRRCSRRKRIRAVARPEVLTNTTLPHAVFRLCERTCPGVGYEHHQASFLRFINCPTCQHFSVARPWVPRPALSFLMPLHRSLRSTHHFPAG